MTAPFDVCGPLPGPGITSLEASAGTGKTYTLTALVARYVAEGVPLSQILAVTFTRAATGELRERVRSRLVATAAGVRGVLAGSGSDDGVVGVVASGTSDEVALRLGRLDDAVANFDAATIATTHGFCQQVLEGLGTAGDVVSGTTLLDDPTDLVADVLADVYLRQALRLGGPPGFRLGQARDAAVRAFADDRLEVRPTGGEGAARRLAQLVEVARREFARRLAQTDRVTYDRLLSRLAAVLEHPDRRDAAGGLLRTRFRCVLVDEFQDTDPVQWRIVESAFGDGATTVVLVGDPKQAIYSFRGADVRAYLDAVTCAGDRRALTVNWRSDQPLLDALDALLTPLQFGDAGIRFSTVAACADHRASGMRRGGVPVTPLRARVVADRQHGITQTASTKQHEKTSLSHWVADDVARQVAALLAPADGHAVEVADGRGGWRQIGAADVAVLTRSNRQAVMVREALRAAKVPAVVGGADSVFASPAATDWLRLLDGLAEPSARSAAVAVALGPWLGWRAERVAAAGDADFDAVHATLHEWAATLASRGVAALFTTIEATEALPARVLAVEGGERHLTDLRHVAELLHAESTSAVGGRASIAALRAWLAARCDGDGELVDVDARSRRLDSDAEAVQVCTVHAAKGLEWAVVCCPFLWDGGLPLELNQPAVLHDGDVRVLDVGVHGRSGPDRRAADADRAVAAAERAGEDLRLLYVALTRARHQLLVWWGGAHRGQFSPLGRVLCARNAEGVVAANAHRLPSSGQITAALEAVAAACGGLVHVDDAATPTPHAAPPPPAGRSAALAAARFTRDLDHAWRRSSYTSLTAVGHGVVGAGVASEPEVPGTGDEPVDPAASPAGVPPGAAEGVASPWADIPAGASVGTTVHRVFEVLDFAADDLPAAVAAAVAAVPGAAALGPPGTLAAAVTATVLTPLGPALDGRPLAGLARRDRLDEMAFELPVAGGDDPLGAPVTTAAIAELLAAHLGDAGPLAGYAARLADPQLASTFRGYLTGSLDLVVRHRSTGGERWLVADYKTNRVAPPGRPLTTDEYATPALDAEMQRHHYPLQALLYSVALHRYLEWRLPSYRPEQHLGGVAYLFVRGMAGPATPAGCGVFTWRPDPALVTDLAALLATGAPR